MQLETKKYLYDILEATENIEEYTSGLTYREYLADSMIQAAVERKFEIIGEALNRIKKLDSTVLNAISEHQRIVGFRNVISHGYDSIDTDLVWDAVQNHLPALKQQIKQLLND
jgi:uncharacterized protein with HEPN domain